MAKISLQAAHDQARRLLEGNNTDQAIAAAKHVLNSFPDDLETHLILGQAYLVREQFELAQEEFARVLRADPENILGHYCLGKVYEGQKRLDLALNEYEQALEIRPDMPELRNQLLRLYAEAWGGESMLRLSQPGLARLYAKGHLLAQAIQEFRSIIEKHPDRFDARVGLIEALWRDDRVEETEAESRVILTERSEVLKANLLLGYSLLAAGEPEGETYWVAAQRFDPYQNVARTLFENLPPLETPAPMLDEWDEDAWHEELARQEQARRAREDEERRAREAQAAAAAPAVAAAPAAASSLFSESWMDTIEPVAPPVGADSPKATSTEDDDFLASLLAFEGIDGAEDDAGGKKVEPFSFDDLEGGQAATAPFAADTFASASAAPAEDTPAETVDVSPFSLEDLGLTPEEIASLQSADTAPAAEAPAHEEAHPASSMLVDEDVPLMGETAAQQADEPELAPFSLEDLGLSPEEIAALDSVNEVPSAASAAPVSASDEPDLTPFSFEDLGLSPEEIAALDSMSEVPPAASAAPSSASDEPDLTPFSFEDLGLSPEEIASLDSVGAPDVRSAAPSRANIPSAPELSADMTGLEPFDWSLDLEAETPPTNQGGSDDEIDVLADLQPFSLDDLDLSADDDADPSGIALPSSLQPFSLEDTGTAPPRPPSAPSISDVLPDDEVNTESGAYSWQQPAAKTKTDFLREAESADLSGRSIFSKLKQRHEELPQEEPPPLAPVTFDENDEALAFFSNSNDDISLRDDEQTEEPPATPPIGSIAAAGIAAAAAAAMSQKPAATPPAPPADEEPELTPFSLAELGLSEDEIAALGLDEGMPPATPPTPKPAASPAPLAANEEPELTPFSLAELGLSEEEIASLGLSEAAVPPPAAPATPPAPAVNEEPELTPFSLAELGLSEDEIAALGLDEGMPPAVEPVAPPTPADEEPELTPFSLAELGLSEDEIAALGLSEGAIPAPTPPAAKPAPAVNEEPELTPFSLAELGLSEDEIAALGLDQQEADSVDAPLIAPTASELTQTDEMEPELTPFSLSDLGLSEDEIASLNLTGDDAASLKSAPEAEISGLEDADLQPFSFDDLELGLEDEMGDVSDDIGGRQLGLTEAELAGLDLGDLENVFHSDTATHTPAASQAAESTVDTGDAALDKLINLGQRQGFVDLTDIISVVDNPEEEAERIEEIGWILHRAGIQIRDGDEIIDMDETEEPVEALDLQDLVGAEEVEEYSSAVTSEDAELTPFSLAELGLTEEEIAALGLSEVDAGGSLAPSAAPAEPLALEPGPMAGDVEPDMMPFSLAELGLTEEEIAALGLMEADTAPEPAPPAAALEPTPAAPAPAAPEAEPELTPFSLAELGLTEEEIAALGLMEADAAPAAPEPAPEPPAPAPAKLKTGALGLSPEQIAALSGLAAGTAGGAAAGAAAATPAKPAPAADEDLFDFDLPPTEKVAPVKRTAPRQKEEARPVAPEDAVFVPEPLDALDDIWQQEEPPPPPAKAKVESPPPAKASPPPPPAKAKVEPPPPPAKAKAEPPAPVKAPSAYRPAPAPRSEPVRAAARPDVLRPMPGGGSSRPTPLRGAPPASSPRATTFRSEPARPGMRAELPRSAPVMRSHQSWGELIASLIPSGNAELDEYLYQLQTEPDNDGLSLAVARMSVQTGHSELALQLYKWMIKENHAVDQIVDELRDLIGLVDDTGLARQLYRTLGDAYSRHNRFREAVAAYSYKL